MADENTPINTPSQSSPPAQSGNSNGFAIAALILGLLPGGSVLAIIFGIVALNQIKKNPGQGGKGMALAGLILGIVQLVLIIIWIAVVFIFVGTVTRSVIESNNAFNNLFNDFNSLNNLNNTLNNTISNSLNAVN